VSKTEEAVARDEKKDTSTNLTKQEDIRHKTKPKSTIMALLWSGHNQMKLSNPLFFATTTTSRFDESFTGEISTA
jgi:hypothetical protein